MDYIELAQELGLHEEADRKCEEAKKGCVKVPLEIYKKIYKEVFSKRIKWNTSEMERGVSAELFSKYQNENTRLREAIHFIDNNEIKEWKD